MEVVECQGSFVVALANPSSTPGTVAAKGIHERYPEKACVIAIEFKKIFMDEWTGEVRGEALRSL